MLIHELTNEMRRRMPSRGPRGTDRSVVTLAAMKKVVSNVGARAVRPSFAVNVWPSEPAATPGLRLRLGSRPQNARAREVRDRQWWQFIRNSRSAIYST
jgi:hypothetical protein